MAETPSSHMDVELARRWRALAEQRRAHFLELYRTGRWKHYYDEQDLIVRMRETIHLLEMWNGIAPAATKEMCASVA